MWYKYDQYNFEGTNMISTILTFEFNLMWYKCEGVSYDQYSVTYANMHWQYPIYYVVFPLNISM